MHILIIFLLIFHCAEAIAAFSFQGAVMGYGNMGQLHASYFSNLCERPVAIIEIEESKIQVALEHGYNVYPSLAALLKDQQIDFVAICTPTYLHIEHIREAIKNGLPIFVEKPIVKSASEVREIREWGYPLIFVGEVERYNPVLKSALEMKPSSITISRSVNLDFFIGNNKPWFLDPELSGGIVMDLMIHDMTLLIEKFGMPDIKEIRCSQNVYPCVDQVDVRLEFESFTAHLKADWCSRDKETPISVIWEVDGKIFACDDYLKPRAVYEDPYFIQDKDFLLNLECSTLGHDLEIYLQAVELAELCVFYPRETL